MTIPSAAPDHSDHTSPSPQLRRVRRQSHVAIALVMTLVLVIAASMLFGSTSPSPAPTPKTVQTQNWAGYVLPGWYTSTQMSLTVPTISCAPHKAYQQMSLWTGLGGWPTRSIVQVGIDVGCRKAVPYVSAWTELYPHDQVVQPAMTIAPGDTVEASVVLDSRKSLARATMTLADRTHPQSYSVTATTSTRYLNSAECITENANYTVDVFAQFQVAQFTSCTAQHRPLHGAIRFSIKTPFVTAAPTPLGPHGAFTVVNASHKP
jgi:hypothetical protein